MIKQKKEKAINELADNLSRCAIAVATEYRGVPAKEMVQLRRRLREQGIEYKVVKNTLTRFAAEKVGKKQLETLMTGPVAVAFGYDDVTKPARVLSEYIRVSGSVLRIKGGILGERLIGPEEISILASAPPREVLISQLLGQFKAPVQRLHNVLSAPLRGIAGVLGARVRQMEGG